MQINSKLKSRSCVQIVSSVWICLSYPILINDMRRGLKEDGLDVLGFGDLEGEGSQAYFGREKAACLCSYC